MEAAAQVVLDARKQFPDTALADLYDPLAMPPVLVEAHLTSTVLISAIALKHSRMIVSA